MLTSTYKELKFWQSAKDVSLGVVKLSRLLPQERVAWIIIDQLLRASFSVGANISEGFGKFKGKEYTRFLMISLGSANETEYWLELLKDIYPRFTDSINLILVRNKETIKMLTSSIKTLKSRQVK